jgi:hypothetical protein
MISKAMKYNFQKISLTAMITKKDIEKVILLIFQSNFLSHPFSLLHPAAPLKN